MYTLAAPHCSRLARPASTLALALLAAAGAAQAQSAPPAAAASASTPAAARPQTLPPQTLPPQALPPHDIPAPATPDAKVEHLITEDDQIRIEEDRVRGQTQRIVVHSKLAGGSYQIAAPVAGRDSSTDPRAGKRIWWTLDF